MHPVARVSIKYWNTSVHNKFFGARFIVHFTLHVSAPIGGHLQVLYKHIYIVITSNIFLCLYKPPEDGHRSGPKHVV
jgi:hypothetical protein